MKKEKSVQSPLRVGGSVLIRAVTNYYTGRVVAIYKDEVLLLEAAWIADTGRFADLLKDGPSKFVEVEPYPADVVVSVGRGAIVDACEWRHALPRDQK